MKTHRLSTVVAVFSLCLAFAPGCNVDRIWPDRQRVDGPVVGQVIDEKQKDQLADIEVIEPLEVDLVERVLANRQAYHASLEELRGYYRDKGYPTKESWAGFELESARKIKQFRYVLDAEIPSSALRPERSIPEADQMFEQAQALLRKGQGLLYRQKLVIEAAQKFQEMIERYPDSDKIDDAAFFLGEIHKEYLKDQEALAVAWYERVWQWNPQTPHPARFQAALVYDFRLNDRDRALELYRQVLAQEAGLSRMNRRYAMHRVEEITRPNRTVQAALP